MLEILGKPTAACDGVPRRKLLQAAGAGLFGLNLPQVMAAEAATSGGAHGRAKSVIFLLLFGGPSQLETFDLKPEAPEKIRGPFRPIACRTPGLLIGEYLPQLAAISDKYCVVRTMTHPWNDHSGGGHYVQTGHKWHVPIGGGFSPTPKDWPSIGSVVEHESQQSAITRDLPSYAVVPNSLGRLQEMGQYPRPGEHAGWLGRAYNPLTTKVDKRDLSDNPYWRDCTDEELTFEIAGLAASEQLTIDRRQQRTALLSQFDEGRRLIGTRPLRDYGRFQERAISLVTSERTRAALDIQQESATTRDRYGRHLFGQSALMARRLVEAGVRFVTVHYDCVDGYSWDSHRNSDDVKSHLLPTADQAVSALLCDLDERGLLEETLVVCLGEMGRTPRANANWGRDHWSTLFPALLAGAGVRGGGLYGASDKHAAYPIEHPVKPEDLAATIYSALGIDPDLRLPDAQGRPTPLIEEGTAVEAVFG